MATANCTPNCENHTTHILGAYWNKREPRDGYTGIDKGGNVRTWTGAAAARRFAIIERNKKGNS